MNSEIYTFQERLVDLACPETQHVCIKEIARALSRIPRYNGLGVRSISVARHSVYVSQEIEPRLALLGLLHDAHEAYLGDVTAPLKVLLPDYASLEDRWQKRVFEVFRLELCQDDLYEMHRADRALRRLEVEHVFDQIPPWAMKYDLPVRIDQQFTKFDLANRLICPEVDEFLFMDRFRRLLVNAIGEISSALC